MRLFGILLVVVILLASAGHVYLGLQDWKGRQQVNAAGLRHILVLTGLPVEGGDFAADDETPFEIPLAGGEYSRTVSKKLLESYFNDNTRVAAAPGAGAASSPLAVSTAVVSQEAEVRRVLETLKAAADPEKVAAEQRAGLAGGWLLLQAETSGERAEYLRLIAARDADELLHRLDRRFYRVAPKLYPSGALAANKWTALQERAATDASAKPPVSTDDADRRDRLAHLLVHLDQDAAWQKRVSVVVGLRRYVAAVAAQAARFRQMRDEVDLPLAGDQAAFQRHYDLLLNESRQGVDKAARTAEERAKLVEQKTAADDAVSRRRTQLKELGAQLEKVRAEVDALLIDQTGLERGLYEIQREVGLTLEEVYRLEALLVDAERERSGSLPRPRP